MWFFYNPNPKATRVGDCAVRAVSKALNCDWDKAYIDLCIEGLCECDLPSANSVWGRFLERNGFERRMLPNECPVCYTVNEFIYEHPDGCFVLALDNHVVTVIDGNIYDTWDSGDEPVLYYWEETK